MILIVSEEDSGIVQCVVILRKIGITIYNSLYIDKKCLNFKSLCSSNNGVDIFSNDEFKQMETCNGYKIERIIQIKYLWFAVLLKELATSTLYRILFIKNFKIVSKLKHHWKNNIRLFIRLDCQILQILDYSWEYRCNYLLQEKEHLALAMSWLSTLGGAFSALGDFDSSFAERASATSYRQMLIACRLGDLNLVARCWLYCSLALIQKKKYKRASIVIRYVFNWANRESEEKVDFRIFNMCRGIWTKLKYEHSLHHSLEKNKVNKPSANQKHFNMTLI